MNSIVKYYKEGNYNPYKGIETYEDTEVDYARFWGRDKEIVEISDAILNNNSTILTGYSGCGKSSLINAGISPRMRKYNYEIIKINPLLFAEQKDNFAIKFWESIDDKITDMTLRKEWHIQIKEQYKFDYPKYEISRNPSLWEKLFLYDFIDANDGKHNFVIIIDQFEEIFNIDLNIKRIEDFFRIYEILSNYHNPYFNYFTDYNIYSSKIFPSSEIWDNYCDDNAETNNKYVIVIRKDFLHDLLSYSGLFPQLDININFIERMDEEQAIVVINSSHRFPDDQKKIKSIVSFLLNKENESWDIDGKPEFRLDTMMLSMFLFQLCESGLPKDTILDNFDRKSQNIIYEFYSSSIDKLKNDFRELIGISIETNITKLEEKLISEDGTFRKPITIYEALQCISGNNDKLICKLTGRKLQSCLFEDISINDKPMLQLRHDKLCQCAKKHIIAFNSKQKNAKKYSPDIYLTPAGRLMHDNCYIECVFGPWDSYSSIQRTVFFMEGGINEILNFDLEFADKLKALNAYEAHSLDFVIGFRNYDGNYHSFYNYDGFRDFKIKVEKSKITEVSFWKNSGAKTAAQIPTGYFKVLFYYKYESNNMDGNRVLLKNFYISERGKSKRAKINGYTSIYYVYDDTKYSLFPKETYYLDLSTVKDVVLEMKYKEFKFISDCIKNGQCSLDMTISEILSNKSSKKINKHILELKCKDIINMNEHISNLVQEEESVMYNVINLIDFKVRHEKDNNFGYMSEYDGYGRETQRFFIGGTNYEFDTIKFDRDYANETQKDVHDNLIKSLSYYNGVIPATYHGIYNGEKGDTSIHKVKFDYDSKNRIFRTTYFNKNQSLTDNKLNGICGEIYNYDYVKGKDHFIQSTYLIKTENEIIPGVDNFGVQYAMMHRSESRENRIDRIEWWDENEHSMDGRNRIGVKPYSKIEFESIGEKIIVRYYNKYGKEVLQRTSTDKKTGVNATKPIFISYSRADYMIVTYLSNELDKHKISYYIDIDDFVSGMSYQQYVENTIKNCKYFIVLLSQKYLQSMHCIYELHRIQKNKSADIIYVKYEHIDFMSLRKNYNKYTKEKLRTMPFLQPTFAQKLYFDTINYFEDYLRTHYIPMYNEIIKIVNNWFSKK